MPFHAFRFPFPTKSGFPLNSAVIAILDAANAKPALLFCIPIEVFLRNVLSTFACRQYIRPRVVVIEVDLPRPIRPRIITLKDPCLNPRDARARYALV